MAPLCLKIEYAIKVAISFKRVGGGGTSLIDSLKYILFPNIVNIYSFTRICTNFYKNNKLLI